ncbi:basic proline-rich protein-like [Onychomys torridus]|uniref:basic proline-rich protein-like n=1 Tax=Onychomys torridus TaxID=38674 RepID=UPI00167F5B5B|nr:basic proline-rich protein-like [Onychomys torridus]
MARQSAPIGCAGARRVPGGGGGGRRACRRHLPGACEPLPICGSHGVLRGLQAPGSRRRPAAGRSRHSYLLHRRGRRRGRARAGGAGGRVVLAVRPPQPRLSARPRRRAGTAAARRSSVPSPRPPRAGDPPHGAPVPPVSAREEGEPRRRRRRRSAALPLPPLPQPAPPRRGRSHFGSGLAPAPPPSTGLREPETHVGVNKPEPKVRRPGDSGPRPRGRGSEGWARGCRAGSPPRTPAPPGQATRPPRQPSASNLHHCTQTRRATRLSSAPRGDTRDPALPARCGAMTQHLRGLLPSPPAPGGPAGLHPEVLHRAARRAGTRDAGPGWGWGSWGWGGGGGGTGPVPAFRKVTGPALPAPRMSHRGGCGRSGVWRSRPARPPPPPRGPLEGEGRGGGGAPSRGALARPAPGCSTPQRPGAEPTRVGPAGPPRAARPGAGRRTERRRRRPGLQRCSAPWAAGSPARCPRHDQGRPEARRPAGSPHHPPIPGDGLGARGRRRFAARARRLGSAAPTPVHAVPPLTWLLHPRGTGGRGDPAASPPGPSLGDAGTRPASPPPHPRWPSGWPRSTRPLAARCLKDKPPLPRRLPCTPRILPTPHLCLRPGNHGRRPRPRGPRLTWVPEPRRAGAGLGWGGGSFRVALGPAGGRGGEHGIRGVNPPRKPRRRGGRGRRPQPLPSLAAGGGGGIGAAQPRQQRSDWPARVTCPPAPRPRGRGSRTFPQGRARGGGGSQGRRGPGPCPETPALADGRAASPNSRPPARLWPTPVPRPPPHPPPSPLGTGSAWPPRPPTHTARLRKGCAWPGGGEARAARRAVVRRRGLPGPPRCPGSARWVGRGRPAFASAASSPPPRPRESALPA